MRFEQEQGHQIKLVDMSQVLTVHDIGDGGIHPTLEGYDKMADQWAKAIQPLFDLQIQTPDRPGAVRKQEKIS